MTVRRTSLVITYSQIVVSNSHIANPFNAWTEKHSDQGFAWRPGSVSFATLENVANYEIYIWENPDNDLVDPLATRIIQTPFKVSTAGSVTLESVVSSRIEFRIQPGQYNLRFECLSSRIELEGRMNLVFTRTESPSFAILRADPELKVDGELLLTAEPA